MCINICFSLLVWYFSYGFFYSDEIPWPKEILWEWRVNSFYNLLIISGSQDRHLDAGNDAEVREGCLVPHGVLSLFCNAILSQMFSSGITHSELCPPISIIIKTKSLTDVPTRKCYQGIFSVNIPFPRTTLGYHVDIKTRQDKWRKHSCHCFTPLKT